MNDPQNFLENQWRASEAEITAAQRLVQWLAELAPINIEAWRQEQVDDLDPQDFDPYEDDDWDEPEVEIPQERHMRWDVYANSSLIYSAASRDEALIVCDRITEGNRWAVSQGRDAAYIYESEGPPSTTPIDELEIPWLASLIRTHAGWDVYPKPHNSRFSEGIYSYLKDHKGSWTEKHVYVVAASALEAIERAKFLLCAGETKNA